MFNRNHLLSGLIPGIILPITLYAMLYSLFGLLETQGAASGEGLSNNFRERTLAIVAIAINVYLIHLFKKRRQETSMRGVVVATGVLAIIWLIRFGPTLF
jgi:hypothetical protein